MSKIIKENIGTQIRYDPEPATSGFQKALKQDWDCGMQNTKFIWQKEREREIGENEPVKQRQENSLVRGGCCIPTLEVSLGVQQRPAGYLGEYHGEFKQKSTLKTASFRVTYESLD